jgi:hypothetical protein
MGKIVGLRPLLPVLFDTKKFIGIKGASFMELDPTALMSIYSEQKRKQDKINTALRLDNFIKLDVDDEGAELFLRKLEREGLLPPTWSFVSRRGFVNRLYQKVNGVQSGESDPKESGIKLELHTGKNKTAIIPESVVEGKPYYWLKGQTPDDIDLAVIPPETLALIQDKLKKPNTFQPEQLTILPTLDFDGKRNKSIFTVLNTLARNNMGEGDLRQVALALGQSCGLEEREVMGIMASALRRNERKFGDLTGEVREWILGSGGSFSTKDIYTDLSIITREDKKQISNALGSMEKEGILERWGNKKGVYRLKEIGMEELDFRNADTSNTIDLKLPFDCHKFIKLFPKSIIVVAGASNAGKTAFMINTAMMNQYDHDCHYFSSEMDETEFRERLDKIDTIPIDKWRFKAYHRSHAWWDVIKPNGINLIDYVEIEDNFYLVGSYIRRIFDVLDQGVAIIALQKDLGKDLGIGGGFTQHKSRLYLSINPGTVKIVKAKNRRIEINENPNGLMRDWKLVQGWKFITTTDWYKPTDVPDTKERGRP